MSSLLLLAHWGIRPTALLTRLHGVWLATDLRADVVHDLAEVAPAFRGSDKLVPSIK